MRRLALGSVLGGAVWHFGWEVVRAWLYEQGFHIVNPYLFGISLSSVLHYGVTAALVSLGLWLFWKTRPVSPQSITQPPSAVPKSDLVQIEFKWNPGNGSASEPFEINAIVTAKQNLKNFALIGHFATDKHYLSRVEWIWEPSVRLLQLDSIFEGEVKTVPIIQCPRSGNAMVVFNERTLRLNRDPAMVLLRVTAVSDSGPQYIQKAYHARQFGPQNDFQPVNLDDIAYIEGAQNPVVTRITRSFIDTTPESLEFENDIPDLRVADSKIAIDLFESRERDKLFPLLEAEKLTAWARPMYSGLPPGSGNPPLTKLPGATWTGHVFFCVPSRGAGTINQTFIKTKGRLESKWYDIHLNFEQISKVWPSAAKNRSPYSRDDIDEMLAAMRRISVLINQTAVIARDAAQELMNQWAHILDKRGKAEFMAEMDMTQLKVQAVVDETWEIVKDYRHYHDEIGPILNSSNFSGMFFNAIGQFRNAASMLPGEIGFGATLNLVLPQRDEFAIATKGLQDWMTIAFDRLESTTKRLRDMRSAGA